MIITDHFIDNEWVGITLPTPAEQEIIAWAKVLQEYDDRTMSMDNGNLIFKTMTGEVEYFFVEEIPFLKYRFVLVEDRRNEV